MDLKHSILVTGSHRSGSTWVGRVLACADGVRYVQEPFNRETNPAIGEMTLKNMFAHAPDEDAEALRRHYLEHVAPAPGERLLLKDPIAIFSAPWLQDQFGMRVICLVRHPAGFVSSLIKWQWEFHFGYLTAQPLLMNALPTDLRSEVERYARERHEPLLQACLLWKVIYGWVLNQRPRRRKWLMLRYEDLAKQPEREFRRLFRKLDLDWDDRVRLAVRDLSGEDKPVESDDPGFRARNARAMREVWMSRLTPEQVDTVRMQTDPVWKAFYHKRDWVIR
jgi:hypothetical protein